MPSRQSFSLGRLFAGTHHDDDARWITVNKFPSNAYGFLYDPERAKRPNTFVVFERLVISTVRQPYHEPEIQRRWCSIFELLCLTDDTNSIQAKLGPCSSSVIHTPEQDLDKLLVVSHPPQHSLRLENSWTFQEFCKLYEHYKAMTGSQKRRKTSCSQAGSATTSVQISPLPADISTARPASASASPQVFPSSPYHTRVNALVDHTANRSSMSTKRSHSLHTEGQTDAPRAGIRIPDHTLSIRGPAVRSLPVPTSTSTSNPGKQSRLAHSSDPPMGINGSPDVNHTRTQDVKGGLAARMLRRIQSVTHFRTVTAPSTTKQSAFNLDESADDTPLPSTSSIAKPATQCALLVGEDKAFSMTWPEYERLLRSSAPGDVPAALKARLTTGWGQAMLYIQQANEICGTWMGHLACMTRFSRIVVLDPDERTLAIEVGQGFSRAITDIPDFLDRVDHTTLAWDIERELDARDRSGNNVDNAAVAAIRSVVMTAHQIVAFERYDSPLKPLVHPKQLEGHRDVDKLPTWKKLWAAFSVSSTVEAGVVHASGNDDGAMMMAAGAARAYLQPAVRDRYRGSSSTAVLLQPDAGEDEALHAIDERLRQPKHKPSLYGRAVDKETRAQRGNASRRARREDRGGGGDGGSRGGGGGSGGGGGNEQGGGGGTNGGGGGNGSHDGRGGGPSRDHEGGGEGSHNGGNHGNSQATGSGRNRQASVQPLGGDEQPSERSELPSFGSTLESYGFAAAGGRFLSQDVPPLSRSLSSDETDGLSLMSDRPAHRLHRPPGSRSENQKRASLADEELGSDDQDDHSDDPDLKYPHSDFARASDTGSRAHWKGSDPDLDFPDRFSEVSPARLTDSSEEAHVDPSDEEFFLPCAVRAMEAAGWTKVAIISREEMTSLIIEAGKAILEEAAAAAAQANV